MLHSPEVFADEGDTLTPAKGSTLSALSDGFVFSGPTTANFITDASGYITLDLNIEETFSAAGGSYALSNWSAVNLWSDDADATVNLIEYAATSVIEGTGSSAGEEFGTTGESVGLDEPVPYSSDGSTFLNVNASATSIVSLPAGDNDYLLVQEVVVLLNAPTHAGAISAEFPTGSTVDPAPEPGAMLLCASAGLGLVFLRRSRAC